MALFSKAELRSLGVIRAKMSAINEATVLLANEARAFVESKTYDVFLSHSFDDASVILGLKVKLEALGLSVYVDWIDDPALDRKNVTKATAQQIRHRMKSSKSLLYAHSLNASQSRWMPWELGFMDGFRNGRAAILPISDSHTEVYQFQRQEYLSLYPFVAPSPDGTIIYVWESEGGYKLARLPDWINGQDPS